MKDSLINKIIEEKDDFGSIPFWSWNDKLDPKRLCEQIDDMKKLGMKGFFMHARSGLETEYLSDEWYECIKACVDHAKDVGMDAWSYDENGWPSGFAGGKLLEDSSNWALYLKYKCLDIFDSNAFGVYKLVDNKIEQVFSADPSIKEYHTIYLHHDDSYVDTMDINITKKFIEATHVDYKNRLGDDFGTSMPGFFTDEPQYYRWATPWSNTLLTEFKNRFGYDVMSGLPALFIDYDEAELFRYDYHLICHELFINNFVKPIYEWGQKNNCKLTGHAIEEKFLGGQMWCCGGIMPFYEYMDIPGVDYLGYVIANDLSSKQAGSVCAQLGKKKLLSEMFACCGWDISPMMLKRVAEHQYYGGVNLMCQHLYPYSERGQRKGDYPCHFSEHNTWFEKMADFNEYFNRLGCAISQGDEIANVLVIHPMHSAYLNYKREEDGVTIKELEENISQLIDTLSNNQVAYHFGDEKLMKKYASVEGKNIKVGKCTYDTIVLPLLYTIDESTSILLKEFVENGGKLCAPYSLPNRIDGRLRDLSWLCPNTNIQDVIDSAPCKVEYHEKDSKRIRIMYRQTENGKLYYVLNEERHPISNVTITFKNIDKISVLDLDTLEFKGINHNRKDNGIEINIDFDEAQSYIFFEKESKTEPKRDLVEIEITNYKNTGYEKNALTLDYAQLSFDGETYGKRLPLAAIRDNLLFKKYKGKVWLKFGFESKVAINSYGIVLEPLNYDTVSLNGSQLTKTNDTWIDKSFNVYTSDSNLNIGSNELIISFDYYQNDYVYHVLYDGVSESLRNCLCFDTEIENAYLIGDFCVETETSNFEKLQEELYNYSGDFVISESHPVTNVAEMNKDGYPFYNGKMKFELKHSSGNLLRIPGVYPVCDIYLNGKLQKTLMFNKYYVFDRDITENDKVEIVVFSSNRNLLGHHHFSDPHAYSTPPYFSFENGFKDKETCDWFKDGYTFTRFGLDI